MPDLLYTRPKTQTHAVSFPYNVALSHNFWENPLYSVSNFLTSFRLCNYIDWGNCLASVTGISDSNWAIIEPSLAYSIANFILQLFPRAYISKWSVWRSANFQRIMNNYLTGVHSHSTNIQFCRHDFVYDVSNMATLYDSYQPFLTSLKGCLVAIMFDTNRKGSA